MRPRRQLFLTQMAYARMGVVTEEMETVAKDEGLEPNLVRREVAIGRLVIPANVNHKNLHPIGIGISVRCKVNANIGSSPVEADEEVELEKLETAIKYGADTVMDLSTGGDLNRIRERIIERSTVPVGTVPVYQLAKEFEDVRDIRESDFIDVVELHARQGVDFMTIHAGILREHLPLVEKRVMGIVSRGGSILACWMAYHNKQNPYFERFDDILDIARKYDVTLSLGDGLRPGCLADANDSAQFSELEVLGELTTRAWQKNVQVIIEGPGHIPIDKIVMNLEKARKVCREAPFYVLGPIVTDIAPGYDHITSAIGSAIAGWAGASFICYVTPSEHLGLPTVEDVRVGVISARISAHIADMARGIKGAREWDDEMSRARFAFDWEKQFKLAIDPDRAREIYSRSLPEEAYKTSEFCSMCGAKFCAIRLTKKALAYDKRERSEDTE